MLKTAKFHNLAFILENIAICLIYRRQLALENGQFEIR